MQLFVLNTEVIILIIISSNVSSEMEEKRIPRRHETAVLSVFRPDTSCAVADGQEDLRIEATAIDGKNRAVMSVESQGHFLGRRSRLSRTTDHDAILQTEHELRAYAGFVIGRRNPNRPIHLRLVWHLKIEHENFGWFS